MSGCKEPDSNSMPRTGASSSSRSSFCASTSIKRRRSPVTLASPNRSQVTRSRTMPQLQPQRLNAGLALPQELRAARDQRLGRLFQIGDLLDLRLEIAARPKPLPRHERPARRELPRQRNIQVLYRGWPQPARQTGPRQAQQLAHPRHAHGAQSLQPRHIPGRAGDGQLREMPGQGPEIVPWRTGGGAQ